MKRQWWVFRLTRRWDFISVTYEFENEGAPDESWLDDLREIFGEYLIYDSPRVFDPDDPAELERIRSVSIF